MAAPRIEPSWLEAQVSDRPVKKEYEPPRLEQVGTLEEVTMGDAVPNFTDNNNASLG